MSNNNYWQNSNVNQYTPPPSYVSTPVSPYYVQYPYYSTNETYSYQYPIVPQYATQEMYYYG